ncbi:MAG: hypothetical protein PF508_10640 [Spirochaeta sp.]|jgi:hypothetical protein|nr:hypothetical protein [Spirochaeta sp.]
MESDYSKVREVVTCSSAEIANKWIAGGWTLLNILNQKRMSSELEIVYVLGWTSSFDILHVDPAQPIEEIEKRFMEHMDRSTAF